MKKIAFMFLLVSSVVLANVKDAGYKVFIIENGVEPAKMEKILEKETAGLSVISIDYIPRGTMGKMTVIIRFKK